MAIDPKTVTVLIVEDDPSLQQVITFDFKRKGYRVLVASGGKEAFEIVKREKVSIVISDVRMPDGDGVELLKDIREYDYKIPVVMFVTGFADLTLADAYNLGADALFSKPFDRSELHAAVLKHLTPKEVLWSAPADQAGQVLPKIEVEFPELKVAFDTKVLAFGRGGIFIAVEESRAPADSKVNFKVTLAGSPDFSLEGNGVVRWIKAVGGFSGCGIEIEHLSSGAISKVLELVNQAKTKAYIPSPE